MKKANTTLEVNGVKEEIKLTWASITLLNNLHPEGNLDLIAQALQGNMETFRNVINAGLLHTKKDYSFDQVEEAIDKAFSEGKITMTSILDILNEVVLEHPFYKGMVERMLNASPESKDSLAILQGKK